MIPYITSDIAVLLSPEQRLSVVEKLTEELMLPTPEMKALPSSTGKRWQRYQEFKQREAVRRLLMKEEDDA